MKFISFRILATIALILLSQLLVQCASKSFYEERQEVKLVTTPFGEVSWRGVFQDPSKLIGRFCFWSVKIPDRKHCFDNVPNPVALPENRQVLEFSEDNFYLHRFDANRNPETVRVNPFSGEVYKGQYNPIAFIYSSKDSTNTAFQIIDTYQGLMKPMQPHWFKDYVGFKLVFGSQYFEPSDHKIPLKHAKVTDVPADFADLENKLNQHFLKPNPILMYRGWMATLWKTPRGERWDFFTSNHPKDLLKHLKKPNPRYLSFKAIKPTSTSAKGFVHAWLAKREDGRFDLLSSPAQPGQYGIFTLATVDNDRPETLSQLIKTKVIATATAQSEKSDKYIPPVYTPAQLAAAEKRQEEAEMRHRAEIESAREAAADRWTGFTYSEQARESYNKTVRQSNANNREANRRAAEKDYYHRQQQKNNYDRTRYGY